MSNQVYVCDKSNEILNHWIENDHKEAVAEKDSESDFLRKRAISLKERWSKHWENLFTRLQEAGHIDKALKYDDTGMNFNKGNGQLFLTSGDDGSGIGEALAKLLGGSIKLDL